MATPDSQEDWDTSIVVHPGPGGSERPLFVVGGLGGRVSALRHLGELLGRTRPVIGFQTRGLLGHELRETVEEVAAEHIRYLRQHQPRGPYFLAGYSGGGLIAFEIARQLQAVGDRVGFLGILDIHAPSFSQDLPMSKALRLKYELELFRRFGIATFVQKARTWTVERIQRLPIAKRLGLFQSRAEFRMLRSAGQQMLLRYHGGTYAGDITLFLGTPRRAIHRHLLDVEPLVGWNQVTSGEIRVVQLQGDHLAILQGEDATRLAEEIEADISSFLAPEDRS